MFLPAWGAGLGTRPLTRRGGLLWGASVGLGLADRFRGCVDASSCRGTRRRSQEAAVATVSQQEMGGRGWWAGPGAGLAIAVSSDAGLLCRRLQLCLPHTWLPLTEAAGGDARRGGELWAAAKQQPHATRLCGRGNFGLVCVSGSWF